MKKIAIFNHKGGVSKTTTTFHLGWMLANKGKKVLFVDADSQCNLTMMFMGYSKYDEYLLSNDNNNIKDALEPAFKAKPRLIDSIDCIQNAKNPNLYILPGSIDLTEYEVALGMSFQLATALGTMKNLPGSFSYLIDKCMKKYSIDYALIDMNPSLSAVNQDLLISSDYFMIPTSPDVFSLKAVQSLSRILPTWESWAVQARNVFQDAEYPLPHHTPKFLGYTINDFNLRQYGQPSQSFAAIMNEIGQSINQFLVPALQSVNMMLPDSKYLEAQLLNKELKSLNRELDKYCIGQVSNFNKFIAESNKKSVPVYELSLSDAAYSGQRKTLIWFKALFEMMCKKILLLTND